MPVSIGSLRDEQEFIRSMCKKISMRRELGFAADAAEAGAGLVLGERVGE
jgi:hypothetical protein